MSRGTPRTVHPIRSLEALRVVTDNGRHRMLSLLIQQPLAAGEIAARMRIPRTRTYHHLKLLTRHGFIRVVEERPIGRRIEAVYRATARTYRVDAALIRRGGSAVARERASLLQSAADDFRTRLAPSPRARDRKEPLLARKIVRVSAAGYAALRQRLQVLFDELDAAQRDGDPVELAIALFPIAE